MTAQKGLSKEKKKRQGKIHLLLPRSRAAANLHAIEISLYASEASTLEFGV